MSFLVEPPALPVPQLHDEELAELNQRFESWSAPRIIEWAVENFAPHLALAASMQDAVLIDLATKVDPAIEVVFIDTGYHFPTPEEAPDFYVDFDETGPYVAEVGDGECAAT